MIKLTLLRHGESLWNKENRFSGWTDVDLSGDGRIEAREAGKTLKSESYFFDNAYTSVLKRAIRTLWLVLDELDQMWIPVERSWRLNERHYGALQGLNKAETTKRFGVDQVLLWRRSYDIKPPALKKTDEPAWSMVKISSWQGGDGVRVVVGMIALNAGIIHERLFVTLIIMAMLTSMMSGPGYTNNSQHRKKSRIRDILPPILRVTPRHGSIHTPKKTNGTVILGEQEVRIKYFIQVRRWRWKRYSPARSCDAQRQSDLADFGEKWSQSGRVLVVTDDVKDDPRF